MAISASNKRQVKNKTSHIWVWGVAVLGFAVLAIIVALIFFLPTANNDNTPDETRPMSGMIAETTPSKPIERKTETVQSAKSPEEIERERRREMFSKMTVDEKIEYLHEQIRNAPIPDVPTNRLYATSVEQVMDWIFTCEVGNPPPLLPPMSLFDQMHLAEILIMDNPVFDDDTDREVESKETVKLAKEEFIKFLKEGGNPDDFLPYYHGQLVAAHDEYKMARQSIIEMIKTEPDIALEFAKKVNERLAEKGIKQVVIPQKMLDAFGIEYYE